MSPHSDILRKLLLIGGLCALVTACEHNAVPTQVVNASVTPNTPGDTELVATPAGWFHRSCVHEIPNGAHFDARTRLVKRLDGTTFEIPECQYPAYPDYPTRRSLHGSDGEPADTGWVEYAYDYLGASNNYAHLTASWKVPNPPTGSYSGIQAFYSFPGLENIDDDTVYILQPVIQYGYNGDFGGSEWKGASWRCDGLAGS